MSATRLGESASRSAICRVDAAVLSAQVQRIISPLGLRLRRRALRIASELRQHELALEQARYEATHARPAVCAVDPDNRLVTGELERRWNGGMVEWWNERLAAQLEPGSAPRRAPASHLSDDGRAGLLVLAEDLPRV